MKIGTYYYPEQWPREQWQRDFDNIVAMGLQIVHMSEFAWFTLEPKPGEFHFEWLDECLEMCRQRKLDVILCTPTAAPPVWLANDQTLPQDEHGTHTRFGGRRHYSPTSPAFREATQRIVTAMADHFGNYPSVIGWQIDNEYSGHHDQSEHSHKAFQNWLQRKYGSIDNLNKAWGNQFWNQYYTDFSQILFPPKADPGYANPHHTLDGQRFWSWAFADFNKLQADILKPRVGSRFITTNFMPFHYNCDPGDMADDLSLFSWDSYPVTGWDKNPKDEAYRMADPSSLGVIHDQMASYTGRWALLEIQPGQVNWSGVPVLLYPGAVRLWLWTAIAHGTEFITVYRFRQARFGIELFHHGLVQHDGVTPSPGGRQFMQVIDEVKRLPEIDAKPQAAEKTPVVGLLFDFDQLWYFNSLPQAKRWNQPAWITLWYGALMRLGLKVEILHPNKPWPKNMAMLVAPGVQMVDEKLVQRFDEYAANGGQLILTCRTALMDRNGQAFEGPTAAPILPLIGGTIEAYDGLPEDTFGQLELIEGGKHRWGVWGDLLYAQRDTKVLAKYLDQFYAGAAAVIQRKHGQGTVTYCGVYAEPSFTDALTEKVAAAAKIPVTKLPQRVQIVSRGKYRIALNYQVVPFDVPAPANVKFLVGSRRLEPAGVAVWEE